MTTPLLEKEPAVSKRTLHLDDDALAAAAAHFETQSPEETVNAALRAAARQRVTARKRREQAWNRLSEMAKNGDFDMLLDKRNYRPRLPPFPAAP